MIVQQIERIRLEWMTTMIWDPSTMTMKDKQSMIEYLLSSKLFCPLISCSCDGNAQKKYETFVGSWEFDATVGKVGLNPVGRLCVNKLVASETQDLIHYHEFGALFALTRL
jgi:hypothetical protein